MLHIQCLCIPRVYPNISEKHIRNVFQDIKLGEIGRIDIVPKLTDNGEKFNRVFIHFKKWYSNINANRAHEILLKGEEIKVIYDDPWFWKISAYRQKKQAENRQAEHRQAEHRSIPNLTLKKPQLRRDIAQNRKINGEPKTPGTPKTPPTPIRELLDYFLDDKRNIQEEELNY